jgi:hypothetical protein
MFSFNACIIHIELDPMKVDKVDVIDIHTLVIIKMVVDFDYYGPH